MESSTVVFGSQIGDETSQAYNRSDPKNSHWLNLQIQKYTRAIWQTDQLTRALRLMDKKTACW